LKLIDIGINLMHKSFSRDREAVIRTAEAAGVSPLIITGSSIASSREAADYAAAAGGGTTVDYTAVAGSAVAAGAVAADYAAGKIRKLYATAGVHPHDAKNCGAETLAALRELAGREAVVAIGECGLDYNRDFSPRPIQREWFEKQVELAAALEMPLFLHERDAFPDFAAILEAHRKSIKSFVVHCFTGDGKTLERYLELGAYIGITGWICDERRGKHLAALIREIPAERLMVETDAPYLLPRDRETVRDSETAYAVRAGTPGGKSGRNEPRFLPHIVRTCAGYLGKDAEQVAVETRENTLRFFGLGEGEQSSVKPCA
jgi:TatD DNase family protein